ncbi:MAG: hypothetical protein M1133_05225 [Armatimonadetes bacterium]|nr:hypothetical protein [Armatimonadota bacterium]
MGMTMRPGETSGLQTSYVSGRFARDDAYVVSQVGGVSPFGNMLCTLGSDYFVELLPDGSGRSWLNGRPITSPNGTGKAWYIKDCDTGGVWSAFHGPVCWKSDEYEVGFSPGVATGYCLHNKIASTVTIASAPDASCEIWHVKLQNMSANDRTLSFTTYVRPRSGSALECKYLKNDRALVMRRPLDALESDRTGKLADDLVYFHAGTLFPARYEIEKSSFIGEGRTLRNPQYFEEEPRDDLGSIADSPIASFTVEVELPIEGEAEFGFCFGAAHCVDDAVDMARKFSTLDSISQAISASRSAWKELTSTLKVETHDPAFDALVNTWLPYESAAEWVREHAGNPHLDPYKAADALRCLMPISSMAPDLYRDNLLNFASRLSVLGTYCPNGESQVTMPPAELLWLVVCTAKYVAESGDGSVLPHTVPLQDGPCLTLQEHCERALRTCLYDGQSIEQERDQRLLERALKLWSYVSEDSDEFDGQLADAIARQLPDMPEYPEQRSLPRLVKYFQSISPSLAHKDISANMEVYLSPNGKPRAEASTAYYVYSVLVEQTLGLTATTDGLILKPNLPESWNECRVTTQFRGDTYHIHFKRSSKPTKNGLSIVVDGEPVLGEMLPFVGDGGEHDVEVTVA